MKPLSIYQVAIWEARDRGESFEDIAEKLGKTRFAVKKTWHHVKGIKDRAAGVPVKHVAVSRIREPLRLRDIDEANDEADAGLRCKKCLILFPADCTPSICMARLNCLNEYDALCNLIGAAMRI